MHLSLPSPEQLIHASHIDRVERQILDIAMEQTGSRHGAVFLWNHERDGLSIDFHVVDGVEREVPRWVMRHDDDSSPGGIALFVAESRRPYLTNEAQRDPHYAPYHLEVQAIAAAPILYQERTIGVITVSSVDANTRYAAVDLDALSHLAAISAPFLRRAQLYRQWKKLGHRHILIKGLSEQWRAVERLIEQVSPSDVPVLIRGESGTGKELVAHAIHFNSSRADGPLITLNCAAIPEPLLESTLFGHVKGAFTGAAYAKIGELAKADRGTLFLDEVGELSPSLQAKVLRAIELGEYLPLGSNAAPLRVDVRILAATNRDLETMMAERRFREDLYFRLAVITIMVPALRSYLENLEVFCDVFVGQANDQYHRKVTGISPEALSALRAYSFPGNVRELKNLLERAVLTAKGDRVELDNLGARFAQMRPAVPTERAAPTLDEMRRRWVARHEPGFLTEVLDRHAGSVSAASRALGVHRTTLYRLMKRYGIGLERRVNPSGPG